MKNTKRKARDLGTVEMLEKLISDPLLIFSKSTDTDATVGMKDGTVVWTRTSAPFQISSKTVTALWEEKPYLQTLNQALRRGAKEVKLEIHNEAEDIFIKAVDWLEDNNQRSEAADLVDFLDEFHTVGTFIKEIENFVSQEELAYLIRAADFTARK